MNFPQVPIVVFEEVLPQFLLLKDCFPSTQEEENFNTGMGKGRPTNQMSVSSEDSDHQKDIGEERQTHHNITRKNLIWHTNGRKSSQCLCKVMLCFLIQCTIYKAQDRL